MGPDEGQFVTLNGLTGMTGNVGTGATAQTRVQELERELTVAAAERNAAVNTLGPRIGDYAEAYRPQHYTPYGRSVYEELGFVGRNEFKELEDTIDRLRGENTELRQQVSSLQSMILNLDALISEVKQVLRFRYVD